MSKQPKPDSKKYADLISEVTKGQIKVPKFQRSFVWNLDETAKLLDSIVKGYPIGTFILWETNESLNHVKNIGNLDLPDIQGANNVQYVLDGQQRITSLYAAHEGAKIPREGDKKITDYKEIYVNLDGDIEDDDTQIITSEKPEECTSITLNEILHFNDNFAQIKDSYSDDHQQKINQLERTFSTYDFSTIVLRKEDINSAIEVFTRINTGGQKLTLFEIMSAKTYDENNDFDMEERFKNLINELSDKHYHTFSSSVILSILGLVLSKSKECTRRVILKLDKQDIIEAWDEVISTIKESIDYFRSVYRIPVSALLPYDSLLVPFAYFFYYNKKKPKGDQIKFLEEFFWRISLSFRYSVATNSALAQDTKRIDEIIKGNRPNYDEVKVELDSPEHIVGTTFKAGSSYCKAILCLFAYHEPKDFLDNGKVILDNSWLKVANSKNYHHFFPRSYLKKKNIENENSIVNITLISDDLNKKTIGARAPSVYMKEFSNQNTELPTSIRSHLINDLDEFGVMSDDYGVFLKKRSQVIFDELKKRIELNHVVDNQQSEIKELLLIGENEKLEFKSTMRFDLREQKLNKKLEFTIAKTISAFLNSDGGTLVIGVEDNGNVIGLINDFQTLTKKDNDGFQLALRQGVKKYLGDNFEKYLKVKFSKVDDKEVCIVTISKSGKPVFIKNEEKEEFYIRNGNASIPMTRKEQSEYEKLHW